jgi:ParB family transcriptional regulator, chromosome partitioning protein
MARKISFDLPADEPHPPPLSEATPTSAAHRVRPLLGLDRPIKQSGALGAISQSLGGISEKAKRADEIEQRLIQGQTIVDIDPSLIDGSFIADRMEATAEQNDSFRELIRRHGQTVPILVRPKAGEDSRYEVAFGHRRLRAARELGVKVRAVVRALTDEELVIAQGQENSGRTDLTFIERARFAARLEERRFSRETIMAALNVDKGALSRLIAIATRIPPNIIEAIGPAPSFGRVRWQELTDLLDKDDNRARAVELVNNISFQTHESDRRFEVLVATIRVKATRARAEIWAAKDGTRAARVVRAGRKMILTFDDRAAPRFGDFVRARLQSLYDDFKSKES